MPRKYTETPCLRRLCALDVGGQWTLEELAHISVVVLSLRIHANWVIGRFVVDRAVDSGGGLGCRSRKGLIGIPVRVVVRTVRRPVLVLGLIVLCH